ncbi:hypothetical protein DAMA08_021490 [Martiniozyma asiatica (nom. inval.)]|nr:hypothetical protein DAMA08_021490 [Martiniozyma asiatica]
MTSSIENQKRLIDEKLTEIVDDFRDYDFSYKPLFTLKEFEEEFLPLISSMLKEEQRERHESISSLFRSLLLKCLKSKASSSGTISRLNFNKLICLIDIIIHISKIDPGCFKSLPNELIEVVLDYNTFDDLVDILADGGRIGFRFNTRSLKMKRRNRLSNTENIESTELTKPKPKAKPKPTNSRPRINKKDPASILLADLTAKLLNKNSNDVIETTITVEDLSKPPKVDITNKYSKNISSLPVKPITPVATTDSGSEDEIKASSCASENFKLSSIAEDEPHDDDVLTDEDSDFGANFDSDSSDDEKENGQSITRLISRTILKIDRHRSSKTERSNRASDQEDNSISDIDSDSDSDLKRSNRPEIYNRNRNSYSSDVESDNVKVSKNKKVSKVKSSNKVSNKVKRASKKNSKTLKKLEKDVNEISKIAKNKTKKDSNKKSLKQDKATKKRKASVSKTKTDTSKIQKLDVKQEKEEITLIETTLDFLFNKNSSSLSCVVPQMLKDESNGFIYKPPSFAMFQQLTSLAGENHLSEKAMQSLDLLINSFMLQSYKRAGGCVFDETMFLHPLEFSFLMNNMEKLRNSSAIRLPPLIFKDTWQSLINSDGSGYTSGSRKLDISATKVKDIWLLRPFENEEHYWNHFKKIVPRDKIAKRLEFLNSIITDGCSLYVCSNLSAVFENMGGVNKVLDYYKGNHELLTSNKEANSRPEEVTEANFRPETDAGANSRPEEDAEANSRPEEDAEANSRPEEDAEANSRPEEDAEANSRPEEVTEANSRPEEVTEANSRPEEVTEANSRPEIDENLDDHNSKDATVVTNNYKQESSDILEEVSVTHTSTSMKAVKLSCSHIKKILSPQEHFRILANFLFPGLKPKKDYADLPVKHMNDLCGMYSGFRPYLLSLFVDDVLEYTSMPLYFKLDSMMFELQVQEMMKSTKRSSTRTL